MLEWLASKFAMLLASMLVLASAFILIDIQRDSLEDVELKQIGNKIASNVNSVAFTNAEMRLFVTFDKMEGAISLPSKVNGSNYSIIITNVSVVILQGNRRFLAVFSTKVHPWDPTGINPANKTAIEEMDGVHNSLILDSGFNFCIEAKIFMLGNGDEFHIFIYKE